MFFSWSAHLFNARFYHHLSTKFRCQPHLFLIQKEEQGDLKTIWQRKLIFLKWNEKHAAEISRPAPVMNRLRLISWDLWWFDQMLLVLSFTETWTEIKIQGWHGGEITQMLDFFCFVLWLGTLLHWQEAWATLKSTESHQKHIFVLCYPFDTEPSW